MAFLSTDGPVAMRGDSRLVLRVATWLFGAALVMSGSGALAGEAPTAKEIDWAHEQQFWAFRAPVSSARPAVKHVEWPRQPLDYLILAKIEDRGLPPSDEASWPILLRRVALDLTGLPMPPDEADAFLAAPSETAYAVVVDRLLASPRFGERMASLWLPLARYAEDQAHQVGSDTKFFYPNAWRYREWVINAFNRDLPYDKFITLQLAADRININEGGASAAAEPTLSSAPQPTHPLDDRPALGFLGLGPKYYDRGKIAVMADEWEDRVDTVSRTMLGLTVACARCHDHKFDPITMQDYYGLAGVFASTRMVNMMPDGTEEKKADDKKESKGDKAQSPMTMHIVADDTPQNLPVFLRGNAENKGPVASRRFLRILSSGEPAVFADGSGRRELAAAIADRRNPLTARVMVNRIWGLLFGQPLVATPSNFGHSGLPPSNPALLDDLSVRFMDGGWSVKKLMREIVLSSAWRQSSQPDLATRTVDPENRLISRLNRRRLSLEQWRDSVLWATGELDLASGPSTDLNDLANHRRTVYSRVSRLQLNEVLLQFDYPDANVHAEKRSTTTTALQKLYLLNSPFMLERSSALAARSAAAVGPADEARINWMYRQLFGRLPVAVELQAALEFLRQPSSGTSSSSASARWAEYAQVLLASNEMLYAD